MAHKPKHDQTPQNVSFQTNQDFVQNLRDNLPAAGDDDGCSINHDELMARLNQLEIEEQEEEARQHDSIMADLLKGIPYKSQDSTASPTVSCLKKTDAISTTNEYGNDDRHVKFEHVPDCLHDITEEEMQRIDNVIHFQHSSLQVRFK